MLKKILTAKFKCERTELVFTHGYKHKDEATASYVRLSSIQCRVSQY